MKIRVVMNEPPEQSYADLVTFEDVRDIQKDSASVEFSLHVSHWVKLGSPEFMDVEITVPDRIGERRDNELPNQMLWVRYGQSH